MIEPLTSGRDPDRESSREGLRGIQIGHLAALAAVAKERSLRAAAESLGTPQSEISRHLAELEAAFGAPLIVRDTPVDLTPAGEHMLEQVGPILARVDAARADLAMVSAGEPGALTVGVGEDEAVRLLARILSVLRRRGIGPRVTPSAARDSRELLERLERCALDLVFAELPLPPGPFAHVHLLDDPYVLLVPTGSPLAERPQPPSLREIAALPVVARVGSRAERELSARFGEFNIVQRTGSDAVARALVAAGVGVAIVPRLKSNPADLETIAIDLADDLAPRSLALVWHSERLPNSAAERFRDVALETCASIAQERDSIDRL